MTPKAWVFEIASMLVTFLLFACTSSVVNGIEQQRAVYVLFNQYETVFYAKGSLLSGSGELEQQPPGANALRIPFANLLQGFDPLGKQAFSDLLSNADAALVGAKDFRPPAGPPPNLGGVQSSFCYIIVLKKRNSFHLSDEAKKSGVLSFASGSVLKWSAPPSEGHPQPYMFYGSQIAGSYVLVCNSSDDLNRISNELSPATTAPNLTAIRDWTVISEHQEWGYRRYRHTDENKTAAGTSEVGSGAQALSFFADPKQKIGVLRLFSSSASTADKMNSTGTIPPFKAAGIGVWESTIPLNEGEKTSEQMLAAMSWFGFGVYL